MNLRERSIEVIARGQADTGAIVACPTFATYQYCWLRDGSFIAHAMNRVGRHDVAERFHRWVHATLSRYHGRETDPDLHLHARYRLDGSEGDEPWGNFQLDGYGTWLWSFAGHLRLSGSAVLGQELQPTARFVARYLAARWWVPNHDAWEEFGDRVHTSTLAALFGGLRAAGDEDTAAQIRAFVLREGVRDGRLVKFAGEGGIDASLLWAAVPFGLLPPDDPVMAATVAEIERRLATPGVHRYPGDTYYGGGEWIILTAWLGWYWVRRGNRRRAHDLLAWVEAQADAEGHLPEQVPHALNAPDCLDEWVQRWGPVAKPLLWSHAMYLVLLDELSSGRPRLRLRVHHPPKALGERRRSRALDSGCCGRGFPP